MIIDESRIIQNKRWIDWCMKRYIPRLSQHRVMTNYVDAENIFIRTYDFMSYTRDMCIDSWDISLVNAPKLHDNRQ